MIKKFSNYIKESILGIDPNMDIEKYYNDDNNFFEIFDENGIPIIVTKKEMTKLKEMGYVYDNNTYHEKDFYTINTIIGKNKI